jgi:hypothetical protein
VMKSAPRSGRSQSDRPLPGPLSTPHSCCVVP